MKNNHLLKRNIIFQGSFCGVTLPETNIAPKNGWLEYYFPIGEAYFQGRTVSFREGRFLFFDSCHDFYRSMIVVDQIPGHTPPSSGEAQMAGGAVSVQKPYACQEGGLCLRGVLVARGDVSDLKISKATNYHVTTQAGFIFGR